MTTALGTINRPVSGDSAMELGAAAAQVLWEKGEAVYFGGDVWEKWPGGWRRVEGEQVEKRVLEWLGTVHHKEGDSVRVLRGVDRRLAADTVWVMQRNLLTRFEEAGVFLEEGVEGVAREWCVATQDKLVEVKGDGSLNVMERPGDWFDTGVSQCQWGGECPVYERVVGEWSQGDEKWVELMERACGAAMLRYRGWHRWVLLEGRVRGGKGTILRMMQRLLGEDYWGTSLSAMGGEFGLQGLSQARVVGVGEAVDMDGPGMGRLTGVVKSTVGEDQVTVNRKHMAQKRATLKGMVFVCANGVPKLGNRGGGLSSKMLVLPFKRSFLGQEDLELDQKLGKELGGVLRRWMEAAGRLRVAPAAERWPVPAAAAEVAKEFREESNVFQAFLEEVFVVNAEGWTESGIVWGEWQRWRRGHGAKVEDVPHKWLLRRLVSESEWHLGTDRSNGLRFLKGCSLKPENPAPLLGTIFR